MTWGDVLTLAMVGGIVVAIVLARRKGRKQFQAAMSVARAEGHAAATAELSAKLVNHVQVVAGNSLPGEVGRESDAIVSALRFLAVESERASMRDLDRHDGGDDLRTMLAGRRGDGDTSGKLPTEWASDIGYRFPSGDGVARGEAV